MSRTRYDEITRLLDQRQPACGAMRVIALDGPSGSGKTSIAVDLAEQTGAALLQCDDVYPGWHGLSKTPPMIAAALGQIAVGEIGLLHRWDWDASRRGEQLRLPPTDLLIIDGVGSGSRVISPFLTVLVWVEAPLAIRKRRALARDRGAYEPWWDIWATQETNHFSAEQTRNRADLVLNTGPSSRVGA